MTNDLNEIIKANTEQMHIFTDTVKYVIQGCKSVDKKSIKHASDVFDSFKMIINAVKEINLLISTQIFNFRADSFFKSINEIMNLIKNITQIKFSNPIILKLKLFYLKFIIKTLYNTINSINKDFANMQNLLKNLGVGIVVKQILSFFDEISSVVDTLKMINLKFIISAKIKLIFFKSFIKSLFSSFSSITNDIDINKILSITLITKILHFIINQFNELLLMIKQFLSFKTMFWLWWMGKKYIKRLRKVVKYINRIIDVISEIKFSINNNVGKIMMDVIKLTIILYALHSLIILIKTIRIPILFKFKVKRVISVIRVLQKLIFEIIGFTQNINKGLSSLKLNKSIKILKKIKKLFNLIIDIVKTIIIATIAVVAFIPVAIIFLSGLVALKLIIDATIWLIKSIKFVGIWVFIKLTLFMILITILIGIGITFVVFSLLIPSILKSMVVFGAFILGLMGITLLLAVFGGVISLLAPIIPFILVGLALVSTLIIAIGLIIMLLKVLEVMDLDTEKITKNIQTVLDISKMIIDSIFNSDEKSKEDDKPKPWYESVLNWLGGTISPVIRAILSVAFLALIFVSIALITLIATSLRLLQILNLDPARIAINVAIVMETAKMIIDSIFEPVDDKEDKPSNKGFFLTILEFLCKPLADIFTAIMAIGFLALIFVSIALITAIAGQLKMIEKIQLNANTIKKNTSDVIDAAKHVINAIIQPDDSQPKEANGIFRKILEMVLPSNMLGMIDAMMAIGFLALAKSAVGLVGEIAMNLTTIANLPSMNGITNKVDSVINGARSVINKIINNNDEIDDDQAEKIVGTVECMNKMIHAIRSIEHLADVTNTIKIISEPRIQQIRQSINYVTDLLNGIIEDSKTDFNEVQQRLDQLNYLQNIIYKLNNIDDKHVENSEAILKNYSSFIDKVNSINLENIKTTTNLFGKMAELSSSINGDFQGLAEALNDKIAPLLEELKEVMSEMQIKIEQTGSDISSSVYASSKGTLSTQEMAAQTSREMPSSSQAEQDRITERRMAEQAQRQSNDLASKLDELIDMFRNGEAYVRGHY